MRLTYILSSFIAVIFHLGSTALAATKDINTIGAHPNRVNMNGGRVLRQFEKSPSGGAGVAEERIYSKLKQLLIKWVTLQI
ncbi:hypothetical protein PI124_g5938 [Phytophthora idaei]|nr:hypothetical protein PI125_g2593 [Phytophthora idaei]KAG3166998.1 hypothetical protein PI126_g3962 [Phytophthora idaei]KAG3249426.1 hypothetical protein PI124_g5938 [Phytophthora idaei]